MTQLEHLEAIEKRLWSAADTLRANSNYASNEYFLPVMGLHGGNGMNNSEILIYQAADGKIKIDVRLEDKTVWLTQDHMAGLFGKARSTINEHIKHIFAEGELVEADEGALTGQVAGLSGQPDPINGLSTVLRTDPSAD